MTRLIYFLGIGFVLMLGFLSCTQPPSDTHDWLIEVVPAGNEYFELREYGQGTDGPPPSEGLLAIVRALSPAHVEVGDWHLSHDGSYRIRAEAGSERYDYHLSGGGEIIEVAYRDDSRRIYEKAYALVLRGTKEQIPLEDVPSKALKTLSDVVPDAEVKMAWIASTTAGPRYVIVVGESVYYARPDGQIQAARRICDGALEENYPRDGNRDAIIRQIRAEGEESFGAIRQNFDYEKQIETLMETDPGADAAFRFVVMGDSRSNERLWNVILDHISSLNQPPVFVINTGDLVPRGFIEEFRDYFVPPLLDKDFRYFSALGNHDTGFESLAMEYRLLFGENSLNYYFDYGNYRFIFFDNCSKLIPMEEALSWLDEVLSSTPEGRHIVVSSHKPFRNIEKWAYHSMNLADSEAITSLMSKYDVSHVFLGHIHAYSTASFEGVDYTVAGGGGAGLHDRFGPGGNIHHYIIIDAQPGGVLKQQLVRFTERNQE
jgi:hypothetical protein